MCLILVTGIPASGKSTMAAYLSKHLGIPVISKDRIKELLFDTIGFESRAQKVKLGEAAMHIMCDMARSCLLCNQGVILENNFEYVSREELSCLIEECGAPVLTVMMTGDWRVIYERFKSRNEREERHLGHVVNDCYPPRGGGQARAAAMPFEVFVHGMRERGMVEPPADTDVIAVDTTDLSKLDMERVAQRVREWMKERTGYASGE